MDIDRDHLLGLDDEALLKLCEQQTYRASGPGGQHRNTTETAVRLSLPGTGIVANGTERRSQHENRAQAVRRLRVAIALQLRGNSPPAWPGPWKINPHNPDYPRFVACLLDAVHQADCQVSTAAAALGLSTGQLVRLLGDHDELWTAVNQVRQQRGLKPLHRS